MKLALSTLGCPQWDLATICARAKTFGYDGIDFRGLQEALDITTLPAFARDGAATRRQIADAGLEVSGIASSIRLCAAEKRAENLEEARRTIPVATALGCRNIRVFGGGEIAKHGRAACAAAGRDCLGAILDLPGARELRWLFETHDHWIQSADCRLLLDSIADPAFGALWDMGLTGMEEAETPAAVHAALGARIGAAHVKDAVRDPGSPKAVMGRWRYVPPGEGILPLAESIGLLHHAGFTGYLIFEHEKRWHPELPEPEVVFPAFVRWARPLLQ